MVKFEWAEECNWVVPTESHCHRPSQNIILADLHKIWSLPLRAGVSFSRGNAGVAAAGNPTPDFIHPCDQPAPAVAVWRVARWPLATDRVRRSEVMSRMGLCVLDWTHSPLQYIQVTSVNTEATNHKKQRVRIYSSPHRILPMPVQGKQLSQL